MKKTWGIITLCLFLTGCNPSEPLPQEVTTPMEETTTSSPVTEPDAPLPPPIVTINQNPNPDSEFSPANISGIEPNDGGFGVSFEVYEGSFSRGDTMIISCDLINNTGVIYKWRGSSSDFRPSAQLSCENDGKKYVIKHMPLKSTDDIVDNEVKPGESRKCYFVFPIPEEAPAGEYTLTCDFRANTENGSRADSIQFERYFVLE